jgi:hypothetical protein
LGRTYEQALIVATRQIAPRAVIDDWMTGELQHSPGCEGCHLSLSYRLRNPDASGCNWTDATLRLGPNADARHAWPIAREVVEWARQLFILADEPEPNGRAKPNMDMLFQRRLLYIPNVHIDTNLINAKQKLDEVNRLERWAEDGVILINMSWTAHAEAQADRNPYRMKKAAERLFTIDTGDHDTELAARLGAVLFPGGPQNENQRNDVRIVCEAIKWHAMLVTNDGASSSQPGGILGNRNKLQEFTDIKILSPSEAIAFVESKINERDAFNRCVAKETGKPLPDWTGKD